MDSPEARARGERAHRIGVGVNFLLALMKIGGGLASGSTALLADGYHSLADLATNGIAWVSFRVAARPADDDHHYGHGKAEAAAGLFVGVILIGTGLVVLYGSVMARGPVYEGFQGPVALAVAGVSIVANEWLVRVTRRSADELSSTALSALARDNRSDSLSSGLVIVGVTGGLFEVSWAEPVMTASIGVFIVIMGFHSAKESLDILMDRVADATMRDRIALIAKEVSGVRGVQHVLIHPLGARQRVDMEISVDADITVLAGHTIAHEVEREVLDQERQVIQVAVHVNPA
ncbi:MAG: cation transporter [Planctomycetota bacterium]|nr:MAG: cation transporter [Planctomycetota bacterium]